VGAPTAGGRRHGALERRAGAVAGGDWRGGLGDVGAPAISPGLDSSLQKKAHHAPECGERPRADGLFLPSAIMRATTQALDTNPTHVHLPRPPVSCDVGVSTSVGVS